MNRACRRGVEVVSPWDALALPPHPTAKKDADRREMLEWLGDWDPDRLDLAEINRMLGCVRVKIARSGVRRDPGRDAD